MLVTTVATASIWAKSGAELPQLPFTGAAGVNVYLDSFSNPLEYFHAAWYMGKIRC
jgi:hypothetical protein